MGVQGAKPLDAQIMFHFTVPKWGIKSTLVYCVLHSRSLEKFLEGRTKNLKPFSFIGPSFTKNVQPFLLDLYTMMDTQAFIRDDNSGIWGSWRKDIGQKSLNIHPVIVKILNPRSIALKCLAYKNTYCH